MNYKRVLFESPDYLGTEVIVRLTETDSEETFQNFLRNALTSFQAFVAEQVEDEYSECYIQDDGEINVEAYKQVIQSIIDNCCISSISDISEEEGLWSITTDDYYEIDW